MLYKVLSRMFKKACIELYRVFYLFYVEGVAACSKKCVRMRLYGLGCQVAGFGKL